MDARAPAQLQPRPRLLRRQARARAAVPLLVGAACGLLACGSRREEPEVVVQSAPHVKLDARKAATDRRELGRVVAMSHGQAWALLGAHRMKARLQLELWNGSEVPAAAAPREAKRGRGKKAEPSAGPLSDLQVTESLVAAAPRPPGDGGTGSGDFALVQETGPENGKEVVSRDGVLFTRQRFGIFTRWNKPEQGEDRRWREDAFGGLATYVRLLFRQLEVQAAGEEERAGRQVLRLKLARGEARAAAAPSEEGGKDAARRWRATLEALSVEGHLLLDLQTAVPLDCALRATYRFRKDGEPMVARLSYERQLTDLGAALTVEAPAGAEPLPERPHRLDERDFLLGRTPTRRGAAAPPRAALDDGPARLDTGRAKAPPAAPAAPAAGAAPPAPPGTP